MNATNHPKKIFRADTEKKKGLTKTARRKLAVVSAAAAAIFVILLAAGLSYAVRYTPKEELLSFQKMEDNMKNQMQKEMKTASAYLERLDGSITENKDKLDAVNVRLTERQDSLLEVETTQKKLAQNASDVTVKVKELEKKTETQINTIRQDMETVHSDIRSALDKVSEIISIMEKQDNKTNENHRETLTEFTKVNESVQDVNQSVRNVEEKLNRSYENLKALLEEVNSGEKEKYTELSLQLAGVESSLKALLDADMAQITAALSNSTSEFEKQVTELGEILDGRMNRLDQDMNGLDANVSQLGQDVSGLDSNMNQLGHNIMDGLDSNMDRMDSGMGKLSGSLHEIGTDINSNIGNLGTDINGSIGSLGSDLDGSIRNLSGKLDELHTGVNGSFLQLQQDFYKQMGDINVSSVQNTDALRAYMEELNNALRQDLNQVFISASNGKKGLASALLTKGITVKDDATFAEIKDAILNVPQQLVIGVQEIPGIITYHYHYHLDPDGNRVGETVTSDRQGGCYTTAVYHTHDGSCYNWSHEHNDHCKSHPVWVDWDGDGYWGKIYDCGNSPANVRGGLKCTLPTSETGPIYYELGCGLLDGQIVGAEIVYDSDAVKSRNAVPEKRILKTAVGQRAETVEERKDDNIPSASDEAVQETQDWEQDKKEEELPPPENGNNMTESPDMDPEAEKAEKETEKTEETETSPKTEEPKEIEKQGETEKDFEESVTMEAEPSKTDLSETVSAKPETSGMESEEIDGAAPASQSDT